MFSWVSGAHGARKTAYYSHLSVKRPDAGTGGPNPTRDHSVIAMNTVSLPDFEDLQKARERVRDGVVRTPVERHAALDEALGCELHLKCDQRQPMGAFKLRGASNAVGRLVEENIPGSWIEAG